MLPLILLKPVPMNKSIQIPIEKKDIFQLMTVLKTVVEPLPASNVFYVFELLYNFVHASMVYLYCSSFVHFLHNKNIERAELHL